MQMTIAPLQAATQYFEGTLNSGASGSGASWLRQGGEQLEQAAAAPGVNPAIADQLTRIGQELASSSVADALAGRTKVHGTTLDEFARMHAYLGYTAADAAAAALGQPVTHGIPEAAARGFGTNGGTLPATLPDAVRDAIAGAATTA